MSVLSVPLVGIPNEVYWPSILTQEIPGGKFFLVVCVGSDPEASIHGRAFIEAAQENLERGMSEPELTAFFSKPYPYAVSYAGGTIKDNDLLCFATVGGSVRLYRQEKEEIIAQPPTGSPVFLRGNLVPGDKIILGTVPFFDTCEHRPNSSQSLQEFADTCATVIHSSPETAKISSLLIQFDESVPPEPVPVVPTASEKISTEKPISVSTQKVRVKMPRIDWMRLARRYRKLLSFVVVGLILLLLFLAISQFTGVQRQGRLKASVAPYQERYEKAKSSLAEDRLSSLTQLRSLKEEVKERLSQTKKDKALQSAYEEILRQINETYGQASGEKHIDKLHVYYDFRLVSQDFVASQVMYDRPGKQAVFLDGGHSKLLSLSLEKKQPQVLSVDDKLKNPFAVTVLNRKAFVIGQEGVVELSLPLDQIGRTVVEPSESWQKPKLIGSFGTNLYVLDESLRNLYKYDIEDANASPSAWLISKEGLEFADITSVVVDGNVWLATNDGTIRKYTRGEPSSFKITNLLDPLNSSVALFTEEESEHLYILEPRQKRLIVLDKTGTFISSVHSEDLGTATSLIVDEGIKKAYVLSGSLVYEVEL